MFGPGDGTDTVTDFRAGADRVDLTAFGIDDIEEVGMAATDDGVTIDLAEASRART